jgi:hypothetical protein
MPKRPRQHVLEDLARARLHRDFSTVGWTVERLEADYNEDFLVRIFEAGRTTPWSFFVQSKATDRIGKFRMNDGRYLTLRLHSKHVRHWTRFAEPVVLTVYDAKKDVTYWEAIQSHLESTGDPDASSNKSTMAVRVPTDNLLDSDGLRRLKKPYAPSIRATRSSAEGCRKSHCSASAEVGRRNRLRA